MRQIGSLMALLGLAAIVLDLLNRVPTVLFWIYTWGDGAAWGIKIGLIVIGGILMAMGSNDGEDSPD